jgi:chromosome segregation ATPase
MIKEAELRDVKSQFSNVNITKRELEENKKKHGERVADLQKQLTASYEETKQLKSKIKDLKKENDSRQQSIDENRAATESAYARSQRDQSHAQAEIDTLTQTLRSCQAALKKERDATSSLKSENDAVSTQCRKLNDKNSSLQTEIETLKIKLNQVEGYVEKRIVDSNADLRHFSQNTPTAKKSSYREEVDYLLFRQSPGY